MGRFLNEDTYEGQIDNPLSQNLYTYVENNPLIYSDPSGHFAAAAGVYFIPGIGEIAAAATGAAVAGYGIYKLYKWATSDKPLSDKEIIEKELTTTQKDAIKNIDHNLSEIDKDHLDAYERELKGETVKINKQDNEPFDHVKEVNDLIKGIQNNMNKLENAQKSPSFQKNTSDITKKSVQDALDRGKSILNKVQDIIDKVKKQ